ncbi:nidogen-2 isoform X2 [Neoarius graeffei]|uniref:nidogen-2 isoform X2 n=1 Tax=Neoarius graeffei TaxID=443677 RepID=UPI00298D5770|nr:nidogen-2 isoform X2 [Neoarius graeffei]
MSEQVRACAICGSNTSTLHVLPKIEEVKKKWLEFIFGTPPAKYNATLVLCSDHFNHSDFSNFGAFSSGFALRLFLIPGSVPPRRSTTSSQATNTSVSINLATLRSFIPAQILVDCESRAEQHHRADWTAREAERGRRGAQCIGDKVEKVVTMWKKAAVFLLQLSYISHHVSSIQRDELLPYGTLNGDLTLQEGDDETSKVITLSKPMHFYDTAFYKLYVATNGIISPHDLPMEKQYVDDEFPTEFPVIAPFLADIDTSNGKGAIYYRLTESPSVLNRIAAEIQKGFPNTRFTPTHAIIATWENVAAYKEVTRTSESDRQVNTFQAVVAYDEMNTYALFFYPEDGLQFFGTRPKEMFNVEIELPARVGFTRGEISYFIFTRTEGPYFSVTSNEQSVKNLYQTGNTGVPGVWLFHIGNAYTFDNVIPAAASGHLPTAVPRKQAVVFQTTPEYPAGEYEIDKSFDEEPEYNIDPDFQDPDVTEFPQLGHDASLLNGLNQEVDSNLSPDDPYEEDVTDSQTDSQTDHIAPTNGPPEEIVESMHPVPVHTLLEAYPVRPEGQVVNIEEDVHFDSGVIHYSTENKETCDRFQHTCSQNAYCTEYKSGYCCHCNAGFYGNGRQCLPDGAPQRVNGKVNGMVSVGATPVGLDSIDLHAYIVVGDGRAYTAISEVPEPLGWALMPVTPIGGLFGWLFALKLPNSHNGFNITGAEFIHRADVTFYPGNQRLIIVQTARGLDSQNYLNVETHLEGSVPFVPPGASIQMEPFLETYQYYPSLITSNSVREFTIVSTQSGAEKFTYQLRQNITYRDCRHTPHAEAETLQLNVERIFAMYIREEHVLRYAITNKIGHVGDHVPSPVQVNPCYIGSHDCDTTAQCVPGEGQQFTCVCATGYTGDGRNCYDVDECTEGLSSCGTYAKCVNLPGSHSCQCQSGFEYGHDSRTCIDVDECRRHPCHPHASCTNTVGSFQCRCQPGFHGDGYQCHRQHIDEGRPKTPCEHHRDSAQSGVDGLPVVGAFIPQCDEAGHYRPQQCHGSTGHCWCVDNRGQERAGTRTPPGTPPTNCDTPERPKTHCEHQRDRMQDGVAVRAFIPECDEEGRYRSLQCHGSTGHCWCVDSRGQERAGTRTPPGTPPTNCDIPERPKTHCEQHRHSAQQGADGVPVVGAFIPECDEEGHYRALQCHGSTGHCWCVDSRGQERAGTRTPPGTPPTNCDAPERPKTQCEQHRDNAQGRPGGLQLVGVFIPECDEEGRYRSLQCHSSTGYCWCVDSRGQERVGTHTPPGTPPTNCDAPVHPERLKTQCEQHRDTVQAGVDGLPVVGAFVPECDEEGRYRSQQCHGSTGHCWCVDSKGQERAGTRTPPGTPPTNCDAPVHIEHPKTPCEQHRDKAQSRGDDVPVVGVFIPECDEEGRYRALQCHGATGHCWCVDSRGQVRAGTRTPPGTPPRNCDIPVVAVPTQHSETVCERWRASLMEHYGGRPGPEHFLPQCDASGEFTPVQCYGKTSYCWCVDKNGQEVAGTRSFDKVKPACMPTVAPPTMRPLPRPDVTPPPSGTTLLYAQGQQIGALPLNGTRMDKERSSVLLTLHGSIVVGIDYDCRERKVYWTDLAGRTISRAALETGSEPEILINTGLMSPEGLAVDVARRRMFWVDSTPDKIETAKLDGSDRRVLFNTDLVNPRAIIVDSRSGTLYWTDWNREAPKIESSTVEGHNRRMLVQDGIGLPNALAFDPTTRHICWADAGTKRLECIAPDGTGRRVIHGNLNYPFSMVFYANHFYYTDWRRDGVIGLSRDLSHFTDEYLPDQRSHLYGITVASSSCL